MTTLTVVLGVVALTVWATMVPSVFHGPWAVLVGLVLAALASVTAGYVPTIPEAIRRRRAELAQLEAAEAADQEELRRASELPATGPAGLLDPRRGLVAFTGRERELAGLLAWCQDGAPRGVRLVTGPGGIGKTRLSVELCTRLNPDRWQYVRVGDREEPAALAVARRGWPYGVLLVIDYAETRIGLAALLRAVAEDAGPVRVLLLARSAGEWRDRLGTAEPAVRELLAEAGGDQPLSAAVSAELTNDDLVAAAVPVFAAALGVPVPGRVLVDTGPGAVRVLDLHAAAVVAVLRSAGSGGPVRVSVADVLDELLGHEERFWLGTADWRGLLGGLAGMDTGLLRPVVAAGALLGAASQDEAVELLRRVPGAVASAAVARWLQGLYPPEDGMSDGDGAEWLGSLRPDRLAERLVVGQLTRWPELAGRCLSGLDERQALRAITLLGRAAADQQETAGVLLERVLPLLERVVAGLPADLAVLTAISDAIPYPSAALAEADLTVTRRILQVLPDGDLGPQARWLTKLGVTLAQIGRPAEALTAAQEAAEAYRVLAAADSDRYRPNLAVAMSNLGVMFSALGRPGEALPPAQEAVTAYRELAVTDSGRYRPDLAHSLTNLGALLSAMGRPAEALPPAQEAVAIRRELSAADPDRYRPDLAHSLTNLGVSFSAMGRPGEALPPAEEAAEVYRELAAAYPDRYRRDLAVAMSNLGALLSALGRSAEALPPGQEAVTAYRELAAADPDRYRPDLARSLSNLGVSFSALGRSAEALPPAQEAVTAYRELAAAYPDRYRPDLAGSLFNLGAWFWERGRPAEALPPAQEAVAAYRELAAADPDRYRGYLGGSLQILARALNALVRQAETEAALGETGHDHRATF